MSKTITRAFAQSLKCRLGLTQAEKVLEELIDSLVADEPEKPPIVTDDYMCPKCNEEIDLFECKGTVGDKMCGACGTRFVLWKDAGTDDDAPQPADTEWNKIMARQGAGVNKHG